MVVVCLSLLLCFVVVDFCFVLFVGRGSGDGGGREGGGGGGLSFLSGDDDVRFTER